MDIAVSPSDQIATASFDNSVGVWSGGEPGWLDGHKAAVTAVQFLTDSTIISGGDDFVLRAWPLGDGNKAEVLGQHQAKISSIAVDPRRQKVATGSWDATIGVWSINSGSGGSPVFLEGHRQGVNDVEFSSDGSQIFSASTDGTIRIWNTERHVEVRRLASHGFGVNELVLNEEDGWLAYGAVDGGTRLIDLDSGLLIADFTLDRWPILAMTYHVPSKQLAVGDGEGFIMIIDTQKRLITRDFRATRRGPIWALAFSNNGQNIHAGGIEDIMYSWPLATMDEHQPMSSEARSFLEDPEQLSNGERQFKRKCSICHTVTEGSARKAGPSLYKLFGRPAGSVSDYNYSATLDNSKIVWSTETINDLFEIGPDHYIPDTKMPMQRIAKQQDRDDLIEYLRTVTVQQGK